MFGKMKIEFTKDIPVKSIIAFRMNAGFPKQFLGVADSEFQQISVRRALFHIVFNNSLISIPYRIDPFHIQIVKFQIEANDDVLI